MYSTRRLLRKGQGLVEYALILVLVAIIVIVILSSMGGGIQKIFCTVAFKLGTAASALDKACPAPRVSLLVQSSISGAFRLRAVVADNKGISGSNIPKVEFYDNGTLINTENNDPYCFHSGDSTPCDSHSITSGAHTIRAVAYDADGNTGEDSITISVP
jgi:pilus assembly protein Flp/PilA